MAKAKSTLGQVRDSIADAAETVLNAADRNVVKPVRESLGLSAKPKRKSPTKATAKASSSNKPKITKTARGKRVKV